MKKADIGSVSAINGVNNIEALNAFFTREQKSPLDRLQEIRKNALLLPFNQFIESPLISTREKLTRCGEGLKALGIDFGKCANYPG